MSNISRRKLITTGLVATAGASGLAVATRLAQRHGLIPPDGGGIYGPGETLTYAAQRLLTRHSFAREFARGQISNPPFANEVAPLGEGFTRLQEAGFADWRLIVDGMVARPVSFSIAQRLCCEWQHSRNTLQGKYHPASLLQPCERRSIAVPS